MCLKFDTKKIFIRYSSTFCDNIERLIHFLNFFTKISNKYYLTILLKYVNLKI